MNRFWPSRPSPKGFSIDTLSRKYRSKINTKLELNENLGKENYKQDFTSRNILPSVRYLHWANRDFYEYKDAA